MFSLGKYARPITCLALLLGAILSAMRVACAFLCYEYEIGYYSASALLPKLTAILLITSLAGLCIGARLLVKKGEHIPSPTGLPLFTAIPVALALAIHAISSALTLAVSTTQSIYASLIPIAACLGAVFFALLAFKREHTDLTAIFGLGFIVWLALSWISSYSDFTIAMNSPDKIFFHLGCIGAALLTVAELRTVYGASRSRMYCFSLWSSSILLAVSSLPYIAGAYLGNTDRSVIGQAWVLFTLCVYAYTRAASLILTHADAQPHNADIPLEEKVPTEE